MAYRVSKLFASNAQLTTTVNGRRVALNGSYVQVVPASDMGPEVRIDVPAATQEDLEILFSEGNPCVEQVAEKKTIKEEKNV